MLFIPQIRAGASVGHPSSADSHVRPCDGGAGGRDGPAADSYEGAETAQDSHRHPEVSAGQQLRGLGH